MSVITYTGTFKQHRVSAYDGDPGRTELCGELPIFHVDEFLYPEMAADTSLRIDLIIERLIALKAFQ